MICLNNSIFYELCKLLCADSKFVNIQLPGQYFCKQIITTMSWSAGLQRKIQTKKILRWKNLFSEDLHWDYALVEFLLDQAKLKCSDFGPD